MSWALADSSLLPLLASTGWPKKGASTPSSSWQLQVAAGWLLRNVETVDGSMFIVNGSIEFGPRGGNLTPSPTGC